MAEAASISPTAVTASVISRSALSFLFVFFRAYSANIMLVSTASAASSLATSIAIAPTARTLTHL
jgi:hypothetical protein